MYPYLLLPLILLWQSPFQNGQPEYSHMNCTGRVTCLCPPNALQTIQSKRINNIERGRWETKRPPILVPIFVRLEKPRTPVHEID